MNLGKWLREKNLKVTKTSLDFDILKILEQNKKN
jgi:hypothetical protein